MNRSASFLLNVTTLGVVLTAVAAGRANAQQPPQAGGQPPAAGAPGQPPAAGAQGQRPPPAPLTPDDYTGFRSLFDGRTLSGWDGDPVFWRVEDGVIVAESTPEKRLVANTFLIWRGGTLRDFELKVDVRFAAQAGNSGIQVRSKAATAPTTQTNGQPRPWGIAGPQVDIVPGATAGNALLFEEGGRGFLARQGQVTRRIRAADGSAAATLLGTLGPEIMPAIKPAGEWNTFHVIGRGNQLTVIVNGRVSAITVDDDAQARSLEGLLALQMHTGNPFRVEFRNVYLKELAAGQ